MQSPFEGFSHSLIVVVDKSQNLLLEMFEGGKGAASQQLTDENTEPNFDLVKPRAMFGGVMKDNAMSGLTEKSGARLFVL